MDSRAQFANNPSSLSDLLGFVLPPRLLPSRVPGDKAWMKGHEIADLKQQSHTFARDEDPVGKSFGSPHCWKDGANSPQLGIGGSAERDGEKPPEELNGS